MWYVIPMVITLVALIIFILYKVSGEDFLDSWAGLPLCFLLAATIVGWGVIPGVYYGDRSRSWEAEQFYNNAVLPSVIAEYDEYVVVENDENLWSFGGSLTLINYNQYLRTNRHWQDTFTFKFIGYPAPDYLKTVKVGGHRQ